MNKLTANEINSQTNDKIKRHTANKLQVHCKLLMTNTQCQHKFTRCNQNILHAANKTNKCACAGRCEELEPTDSAYWRQFPDRIASFLRKEIQAAVREEVSTVIGSSTDPIPTTTGTTYRSSTAETRTGVGRDSPSTSTSSTEERTLPFGELYALREKERQDGFVPPKKKMKKQPLGKPAVPAKHMDVEVKVGIASHFDGVFKSQRGKMHSITMKSNADKEDITQKAIAKHSSFDQTFDGTIPYVLLFPDFSEVNFVP